MIIIQNEPFGTLFTPAEAYRRSNIMAGIPSERTPSGKILKADLRKAAAAEWARRSPQKAKL